MTSLLQPYIDQLRRAARTLETSVEANDRKRPTRNDGTRNPDRHHLTLQRALLDFSARLPRQRTRR